MPISLKTYYNRTALDDNAKSMYRDMLWKWTNRENPQNDPPTSDCLAIARQVYCTYNFPRCRDYVAPN